MYAMGPHPTYGIVLVPSVSHALRAEAIVRATGIPCKLIPTPRQLSSDCGTSLRVPWSEGERVLEALEKAGVEHGGIFQAF